MGLAKNVKTHRNNRQNGWTSNNGRQLFLNRQMSISTYLAPGPRLCTTAFLIKKAQRQGAVTLVLSRCHGLLGCVETALSSPDGVFASARSSRCSTSFQSMKRQPATRCCGLSAFCTAVSTNESSSCRCTDVLESGLALSKLDSASKKNSAKCLATIELLKARMYARSSGCVYPVKFRWT